MKKLILFTLVLCTLISCTRIPEGSLQYSIQNIPTYNFTYEYELFDVIINEHDYIFFRGKNTDLRHLIHNPDCKKCQQTKNNEDDLFSW